MNLREYLKRFPYYENYEELPMRVGPKIVFFPHNMYIYMCVVYLYVFVHTWKICYLNMLYFN